MKLYIYDHCPYCVKARMIFGLKDVPFELITLLNDDVDNPTRMIGAKMVPILQLDDGSYMPESMDIIHHIDSADDAPILTSPTRAEIAQWLAESRAYLYALAMPRWVQAPLEEFTTQGARNYFTTKKEGMLGSFKELLDDSDSLIAQANSHLQALSPLIQSANHAGDALGEDDIHLFAALRSLSVVKGIEYPPNVAAYMDAMAQATHIPLHHDLAL